jgi:G3E family GTPase
MPVPVTIVGGFLGSGKTSYLREALAGAADIAVIVNEFGAVGLDHHLLLATRERVELVGGGCACCVRRADLVAALRRLLVDRDRGGAPIRRVVIETSGLADPAPIVFTITTDRMLHHHFAVERVIVTVDAANAHDQLASQAETAKQIAVADELVITKPDLVAPDALDALAATLAALNPSAVIRTALHGVVAERPPLRAGGAVAPAPEHAASAGHTADVRQLSLDLDGAVDWLGLSVWLSMLLHAHGERVLRVKGLVEIEPGGYVAVNAVQHVVHQPEHLAPGSLSGVRPRIVFITRGLGVDGFARSLAAFQRLSRIPGEEVQAP